MANTRDIVFATFNLYNLQLPGEWMYRGANPTRRYTEAEYDAKITWIAEMLRRLDADVIAFQELWSRQALQQAFERAGLTYAFAFAAEHRSGIEVACAVRAPWRIDNILAHRDFPDETQLIKRREDLATAVGHLVVPTGPVPDEAEDRRDVGVLVNMTRFERDVLQVTVGHQTARDVPAIEVFCPHLKSKLMSDLDAEEYRDATVVPFKTTIGIAISTIKRIAEAAALRIILDKAMAGNDRPAVVLGDLNDGQFSDTLAILSGKPSFRLVAESTAARHSDKGLYSGLQLQQLRSLRDVYFTHEYMDVREVIDHVLVSEQFYDWSERRRWRFNEMRIYNDHVPAEDRTRSDHGQVRAAFDWKLPAA